TPSTLPACAAKQVISSPWGAPLLGLPKPVADSHAKDAPRQIPSNFRTSPLLVDAARDSAQRRLRTALGLEWAAAAIACPGPVIQCLPIGGYLASRGENLAGRTNVDVAFLVECEVLPTEGPILALRLIDHWDMRRDLRFVDQPVEVGARTVGRIASKPLGLDVKALLGALDHSPGRAHLGLADGARRLDVHDDAGLHVNQIIVRVGKERRSAHGPRPLRRGIGWRYELRRHFAGGPERSVIEPGEILLGRSAYRVC